MNRCVAHLLLACSGVKAELSTGDNEEEDAVGFQTFAGHIISWMGMQLSNENDMTGALTRRDAEGRTVATPLLAVLISIAGPVA